MSSIKSCFLEIRDWMALNFLKLNDDKTELIDIGYYVSPVISLDIGTAVLEPQLAAKNLGFTFDHKMSLDDQVIVVQQICNINLRNLRRIGQRLSFDRKVQLTHSCILSILDYCNAAYGLLTESNLTKLQKLQNSAVRFIYNLKTKKQQRKPISPYLKALHFLPVRYRMMFKICLLVFKCMNNMAPEYLQSIIHVRNVNNHCLRIDEDFFRLEMPPKPNLTKTNGCFSYMGPSLWNKLPYDIRSLSDLKLFKKKLKTYFFNLAFENVNDIL